MKTYILTNTQLQINNIEDIKVKDIYGIYQNRCKAFWECKVANLKLNKNNNFKNLNLKTYIIKEIDLETNKIINSYKLDNRNIITDKDENKFKIPVFYNNIEDEYDNFLIV